MTIEEALEADGLRNMVKAADLYEELIHGSGGLEARLNLIVIYWQALDPGVDAGQRGDGEFWDRASTRLYELLDETEALFSERAPPKFWRAYIAWAHLGEDPDEPLFWELLRAEPGYLEPALPIFCISRGQRAEAEARALFSSVQEGRTERQRYIKSVLEAATPRRR